MTDNKYELDDLVVAAAQQKPIEFEAAFNDLVVDRIRTAIEDKKVQIAQQMYNYEPPVDEVETDENDDEFGAGDLELDNSEEEEYGETA